MSLIKIHGGHFAVVDKNDLPLVSKYHWRIKNRPHTSYAVTTINRKAVAMHRLIMSVLPAIFIDHIDHNGLNNRRRNLRISTPQINSFNRKKLSGCSSIFKGTYFHKHSKKWEAKIIFAGKSFSLGYFYRAEDAARAYDQKALDLFGRYAKLNFPNNGVRP